MGCFPLVWCIRFVFVLVTVTRLYILPSPWLDFDASYDSFFLNKFHILFFFTSKRRATLSLFDTLFFYTRSKSRMIFFFFLEELAEVNEPQTLIV